MVLGPALEDEVEIAAPYYSELFKYYVPGQIEIEIQSPSSWHPVKVCHRDPQDGDVDIFWCAWGTRLVYCNASDWLRSVRPAPDVSILTGTSVRLQPGHAVRVCRWSLSEGLAMVRAVPESTRSF
jgi:hypothetical protein